MERDEFISLAAALAIGLMVGLEREHAQRRQPTAKIAGSRTFGALALAGSVAAAIGVEMMAAGMIGFALIIAVGYQRTSAIDAGATTEVAALATYALGALAWTEVRLAVMAAVALAALLVSKNALHRFAREVVTDVEIDDALKFFVIAFVVLPLLPDRGLGPYGVLNPARMWTIVVALTGLSWAGHIGTRWLGPERGLLVAGFGSGLVSASATTAHMARLSKADRRLVRPALGAALAASVATVAQMAVLVSLAGGPLLNELWVVLAASGAVLVVESLLLTPLRRRAEATDADPPVDPPHDQPPDRDALLGTGAMLGTGRPFNFWPALSLAGLLTAVLFIARWGSDQFGSNGSVATAGIAGFADVHAPVLAVASLVSDGSLAVDVGLTSVLFALLTNTVTKAVLAIVAGGLTFAGRFIALLVPAVAAGAVAALLS